MRRCTALLTALFASASLAAADVLIVDPAGSQGFTQVQQAIDAAQDGDLILVRSGSYAGFVLAQRSLSVRADVNATVDVTSGVAVTGTPAGGAVILSDLRIQGAPAPFGLPATPGEHALVLLDNPGTVRVEGCLLTGGWGAPFVSQPGTPGGDACNVENSPRTALVDSELRGGVGGGDPFTTSLGGVGGHGLRTRTSGVVLYDCTVRGGSGGVADLFVNQTGGPGGPGCEVLDFGVLASNTQFWGGWGGDGWAGGDGGTGLIVKTGAQAQLLEGTRFGGLGGNWGQSNPGALGSATSGGGVFQFHPGAARSFDAPSLAADSGTIPVAVQGEPGDVIWIFAALAPAHKPAPVLAGVWLVRRPVFVATTPAAVLGGSGQAVVDVPIAALDAGEPSRTLYLQGLAVGTDGVVRLGSPMHVSVVDCASIAPDCNANGSFDTCDVLKGTSVDCNGNSIPDECETDCNANGIADSCDISGGGSADKNKNGIPDECEPTGVTWHVDSAAPAGGNGSAGQPFQSISQGIAVSLDGDTILVADGTYTGPQNRGMGFGGRDIVVRSANGSAACVIDCQSMERAFQVQNGESAASRIEGFTVRDGQHVSFGGGIRLLGAHTTIRDVVFESCSGSSGGGLMLQNSNALVTDCRFEGCSAVNGGGLTVLSGSARIARCTFVGNQAPGVQGVGGAIYISGSPQSLVSHSRIQGNHATERGGGVAMDIGSAVTLSNVLLEGNTAPRGAAIHVRSSNLVARCSTFASNLAGLQAAIHAEVQGQIPRSVWLQDCVEWDDPAANNGIVRAATSLLTIRIERTDLRGGAASVLVAAGSTLQYGPGNLDLDPLFVDPDGPDNDPLTFGDNDHGLGAGSPCIDAGDNALVPLDTLDLDADGNTSEPTPFDLAGNARFVDDPAVVDTGVGTPPIVDLGAYERP